VEYYLGVDVAVRGASGWALLDADGEVCCAGRLRSANELDCLRQATAQVGVAVAEHVSDSDALLAAIEEPYVGINRRTGLDLSRRCGVWVGVLGAIGADAVERLQPSQWRSVLGLPCRPRAKAKAAAMEHARLQRGGETDSSDEADAVCVADALRLRRRAARGAA